MAANSIFHKLIPLNDLKQTTRRFPIPSLLSLLLCALFALSIHDFIDPEVNNYRIGKLMLWCAEGFFWFVLIKLAVSANQLSRLSEHSLGAAGAILLALALYLPDSISLPWSLALMFPALLLGIATVPFITSRDDLSFWVFNRQLWSGVIIAIAAGILWSGGLSAALGSISYLFEVKIEGEIYGDLWSFALLVFAPLYALSWIPQHFKFLEDECDTPPQLGFVINWVLTPLVLVYMLILYAYFIKIALIQELPRGQLSYMVSAFAGLGVITYLIGWPLRNSGRPAVKLLYRLFFPALAIPTAMQALSIYQRIEQYGITEQRYVIILTVIWFALLTVGFSLKTKPPLKWITGVLAILFLTAAIGPFSATTISEKSQFARLEALLQKHQLLMDGKLSEATTSIPFEDRKSISSILSFFEQRQQLERVKPWLSIDQAKQQNLLPRDITAAISFDYIHRYQNEQNTGDNHIRIQGLPNYNDPQTVSGYDIFIPQQNLYCVRSDCKGGKNWQQSWTLPGQTPTRQISMSYQQDLLAISVKPYQDITFNIDKLVQQQIANDPSRNSREMVLEQQTDQLRIRITVLNFGATKQSAQAGSTVYKLQNMTFSTLIGLPSKQPIEQPQQTTN